jgi:protein-disulfide isomerase
MAAGSSHRRWSGETQVTRVLFRLVVSIAAVIGFWLLLWAPVASGSGPEDRLPERAIGDPNAPVTIVEYASFSCPACAAFHTEALPALTERYIATGKVRLVYRDFPLDARALAASAIARCAPEEHYFRFVDSFYRSQPQWSRAPDGAAARAAVERLGLVRAWAEDGFPDDVARAFHAVTGPIAALLEDAGQGGLPPEHATRCLADAELIERILLEQWEAQETHGVRATPTLLIEGEAHVGVPPVEGLAEVIERLLDGS